MYGKPKKSKSKPKRGIRIGLAPLMLIALTFGMTACDEPPPAAPTIIVNTNTNNNNIIIGQPATVKPGDRTSDRPIDEVDISQYGETCPTGSGPATWVHGGPPILHRGCSGDITCTPKDVDKVPVSPAVHGPAPDLFGLISGPGGTSGVQESNRFNVTVKAGSTAGVANFLCVVKGIASPQWSLPIQ